MNWARQCMFHKRMLSCHPSTFISPPEKRRENQCHLDFVRAFDFQCTARAINILQCDEHKFPLMSPPGQERRKQQERWKGQAMNSPKHRTNMNVARVEAHMNTSLPPREGARTTLPEKNKRGRKVVDHHDNAYPKVRGSGRCWTKHSGLLAPPGAVSSWGLRCSAPSFFSTAMQRQKLTIEQRE